MPGRLSPSSAWAALKLTERQNGPLSFCWLMNSIARSPANSVSWRSEQTRVVQSREQKMTRVVLHVRNRNLARALVGWGHLYGGPEEAMGQLRKGTFKRNLMQEMKKEQEEVPDFAQMLEKLKDKVPG